ncbi:MAG TPA: LCP family protein [Dermatophilaceae bacterium]
MLPTRSDRWVDVLSLVRFGRGGYLPGRVPGQASDDLPGHPEGTTYGRTRGATYRGDMAQVSLSLFRPALTFGLSTLLVGAMALSGCSSEPEPKPKPKPVKTAAATSTKAVVVPPPPAPFTAKGVPGDLAAVIKPLYFGGKVPSSATASKALGKRRPVKAAGPVVVKGAVASWKGVPIAVVTRGKDVTLAVKAPKWKVVGGWWPSIGVSAPSLGRFPRHVLLVGSDARPGQPLDHSRGDSLHIVGLDGHGGGGVLGIPRDSYVPLASGGQGKINSSLTLGGPGSLQQTVVSATGVPLEGYILTGFDGFQRLVDGVGGLPLKAPVAVNDKMSGADVKAGANKLTGGQALAYGRARYAVPGGDFGRSANQGRLILAAGGFAKLLGPIRLPAILKMGATNIQTNLSAEQVLTFAAGAYVARPDKVPNKVATGGFGMTGDGQSIVLLNADARRLFADLRNGNLS